MMHTRTKIEKALREREVRYHLIQTDEGGWAIVVPEFGAKILAAGVDSENCLWTSNELAKGAWCVGGQRTWLAPELGAKGFFGAGVDDWQVPSALDPGSYRQIDGSTEELVFQSDLAIKRLDGRLYSLGIVRSISIEKVREGDSRPGLRMRVSNRLINRMDRILEKEVGLWSILQAPAEATGTLLIPVKKAGPLRSSEQPYRLYFGELPSDWIEEIPSLLYLKARAGKWYKIGIPPGAANGTLALFRPSRVDEQHILSILRCKVDPAAHFLDKPPFQKVTGGDVFQCYNSPDAQSLDFCELEAHAPAARLLPGKVQASEVEILLFKDTLNRVTTVARQLVSAAFNSDKLFVD